MPFTIWRAKCCTDSDWKHPRRRVYRFNDKAGTFAGGLRKGRFKVKKSGKVLFLTRGKKMNLRSTDGHDIHVTVRVGKKNGPAFEGKAELVEDRPDLEAAILRAYRSKYWIIVPLGMGRYIRKGLAAKTSVLIRILPTTR